VYSVGEVGLMKTRNVVFYIDRSTICVGMIDDTKRTDKVR